VRVSYTHSNIEALMNSDHQALFEST